jgi:hypothetical protein
MQAIHFDELELLELLGVVGALSKRPPNRKRIALALIGGDLKTLKNTDS